MALPPPIEGSPGSRILLKMSQAQDKNRSFQYALLLNWNDGRSEWQEHFCKGVPKPVVKQLSYCRLNGYRVTGLEWSEGNPNCWYIKGERFVEDEEEDKEDEIDTASTTTSSSKPKSLSSSRSSRKRGKKPRIFHRFGHGCPQFIRDGVKDIHPSKTPVVAFGRWGGVYGGESGVAINSLNGYQSHSIPRGLQPQEAKTCGIEKRINATNRKGGQIYNICLTANEEYWISDNFGYKWEFSDSVADYSDLEIQLRHRTEAIRQLSILRCHLREQRGEKGARWGPLGVCVSSDGSWVTIRKHDFASSKKVPIELVEKLHHFYALQRKHRQDRNQQISRLKALQRKTAQAVKSKSRAILEKEYHDQKQRERARHKQQELRSRREMKAKKEAKKYLDGARMIAYNTGYRETSFHPRQKVVTFQKFHLVKRQSFEVKTAVSCVAYQESKLSYHFSNRQLLALFVLTSTTQQGQLGCRLSIFSIIPTTTKEEKEFWRDVSISDLREIFRIRLHYILQTSVSLLMIPDEIYPSSSSSSSQHHVQKKKKYASFSPPQIDMMMKKKAQREFEAVRNHVQKIGCLRGNIDKELAEWYVQLLRCHLADMGEDETLNFPGKTVKVVFTAWRGPKNNASSSSSSTAAAAAAAAAAASMDGKESHDDGLSDVEPNMSVADGQVVHSSSIYAEHLVRDPHQMYCQEHDTAVLERGTPHYHPRIEDLELQRNDIVIGVSFSINGLGQFLSALRALSCMPVLLDIIRHGKKVLKVVVTDENAELGVRTDKLRYGPLKILEVKEKGDVVDAYNLDTRRSVDEPGAVAHCNNGLMVGDIMTGITVRSG
eukprot:jgi/Bigna1/69175/fgenesh1_pg.8_\